MARKSSAAPALPAEELPPPAFPNAVPTPSQLISLTRIRPNPHNPRKHYDEQKLKELAGSLRAKGQLKAICVRPAGDDFEIVYGERRWRAAGLADWRDINAVVVTCDDKEALQLALVENAQREDVTEYEEAAAYLELRDVHGVSAGEIAARVSKSRSTVFARLKLAELDEKARETAQKAGIPASTALLVARICGKDRQREAIHDIAQQQMSYRYAAEHIQRKYMLELGQAKFDIADETLLPEAGSCTRCPKRTGNQPELFADLKSKDICTDASCFSKKKNAFWQLRVAKAKEQGQQVLPDSEAKKVFEQYGGVTHNAEYVDADAEHYGEPSVRETAGKQLPPTILARNPHTGDVVELVPKDVAKKLQRKSAPKKQKESDADKKFREQQKKERAKRELGDRVDQAIIGRAIIAAEKKDLTDAVWRWLASSLAGGYDVDSVRQRRGLPEPHDGNKLAKAIDELSAAQLRGLVVECVIEEHGDLASLEEAFRIDRKAVAAEVKKASEQPEIPKAKKKS